MANGLAIRLAVTMKDSSVKTFLISGMDYCATDNSLYLFKPVEDYRGQYVTKLSLDEVSKMEIEQYGLFNA